MGKENSEGKGDAERKGNADEPAAKGKGQDAGGMAGERRLTSEAAEADAFVEFRRKTHFWG